MHSTFRWESGFTLIELIVVLTLISILSVIATLTLGSSSSQAYKTAMLSDLRNVATAQEAYVEQTFAETGGATYADNISKLDVNLSNGVTIRLRGNGNGWSARATHERITGARCSVYRGTIEPFPPATEESRIDCD